VGEEGWFQGEWEQFGGVYSSAAVHFGLKRLFVGFGRQMPSGGRMSNDARVTPFMRAVDWDTLEDAWPTHIVNGIPMYVTSYAPGYTNQGLYKNQGETAVGAPAIVNDVVFISTCTYLLPSHRKPALFAFNANTGELLWSAPSLPLLDTRVLDVLGPAIVGNQVVLGFGNTLYNYHFL
jgi:hypothetical protein